MLICAVSKIRNQWTILPLLFLPQTFVLTVLPVTLLPRAPLRILFDKYNELYYIVDTYQYRGLVMATLQIRVDDEIKTAADSLFNSLGLDTSTAVRMFLSASLANDGIPFAVKHRELNADLIEAIMDTRKGCNLHGPFKTGEEAVAAMLAD